MCTHLIFVNYMLGIDGFDLDVLLREAFPANGMKGRPRGNNRRPQVNKDENALARDV